MQFLTKSWAQIQAFLSQLSVTTRWLIGCVLIILVLSAWLVLQYVGQAEMVSISRFASDHPAEAVARLRTAGIEVTNRAGQMLVNADQYDQAMVILASSDLLAGDTASAFDEMIAQQSPWQSNAQNAQALLLAKQKVLGKIVAKMAGVNSASVILSMPEIKGFGATHVRPSGSVNVVMKSGRGVDKALVEAIAGLVSGAVAEMQPRDVVVIDANRGRQFTVKSHDEMLPGETQELAQNLEQWYHEKISEVLGYIPNVILAVNVRVDPVHSRQVEQFDYEKADPLKVEFTRESQSQEAARGGEAGARPNTGLDIASGRGSGRSESVTENRNEFGEKNVTRRVQTREVGHVAQQVNVTVNVPRSYFIGVYKQGKGPDEPAPDDTQLKPIIDAQLAQIQAQVEPLIATAEGAGVVRAHMVPDRSQIEMHAGLVAVEAPGAVAMVLGSDWAKPVGLGVLALLSLGIMFSMVRKATQPPVMPTSEELAGLPPKLSGDGEVLGEAEQSEGSMEGVEMKDEDVRLHKLAQQISEMVEANPNEAAAMVKRWIVSED